jgi:hypothetical protein
MITKIIDVFRLLGVLFYGIPLIGLAILSVMIPDYLRRRIQFSLIQLLKTKEKIKDKTLGIICRKD